MDEKPITPRDVRTQVRLDLREYVNKIFNHFGLNANSLADEMRAAGFDVSPATFYRMANMETTAETETLAMLRLHTDMPLEWLEDLKKDQEPAIGFAEPDAIRYTAEQAPSDFKPASPDQFVCEINTRTVENEGYRPGDLVMFDTTVSPGPGALVLVQDYNVENAPNRPRAVTRIRVWDPPNLVVRTMDPEILKNPASRAIQIDQHRYHIAGTMISMLRRPGFRIVDMEPPEPEVHKLKPAAPPPAAKRTGRRKPSQSE